MIVKNIYYHFIVSNGRKMDGKDAETNKRGIYGILSILTNKIHKYLFFQRDRIFCASNMEIPKQIAANAWAMKTTRIRFRHPGLKGEFNLFMGEFRRNSKRENAHSSINFPYFPIFCGG